MPGPAFAQQLKVEQARLAKLIAHIDGGRWWTDEEPSQAGIADLTVHASRIKAALDEIEKAVGALGIA